MPLVEKRSFEHMNKFDLVEREVFIDSVRVKSELIIVQNTGFMIANKRQIFAAKVAVEVSGLTPTSKPLSSAFVPKQFTECRRLRWVTNLPEAFSHVLEKLSLLRLHLLNMFRCSELNAFYGYIGFETVQAQVLLYSCNCSQCANLHYGY